MERWEEIYKQKGIIFEELHQDMPRLIQVFERHEVKKVLDLGCGSGRHLIYLAKHGFTVYGFDSSKTAIKLARELLKREDLRADLRIWDMLKKFPYPSSFFDAVISIQVIHHGTSNQVKRVIREIERVLKEDGLIFVTVPKRAFRKRGEYYFSIPKSPFYSNFKKIEERVFVPTRGLERGIPHFYFNKRLIKQYFSNFKLLDIHVDNVHHYCILGIKLGAHE